MIFGFDSTFRISGDQHTLSLSILIFLALLVTICLLPALLLSGRRPGWLVWFLFAGSITLVLLGLERAVSEGVVEVAWAFVAIVLFAIAPLLILIRGIRFLYYRSPHLSGIFTLPITAAVMAVF